MEKFFDEQIKIIFNLIRHRVNESNKLNVIGDEISHREAQVLGIIDERQGEPVFQKDIEQCMRIRRSTATCLLQDMERKGLIKKLAVDSDMRLKKIVLTEKSLQITNMVKEELSVIEQSIMKGFKDEEKTQLMSYLDRIKDNLTEEWRQK